jgi:thioredoxin reductase
MKTNEWDAVVIGGGAAGLSAAQMLGRARRRTLVIDGGAPRNRFAAHMHGVLGHDGLDPAELLARGRCEAEAYGVVVTVDAVTAVAETAGGLQVTRRSGAVDHARAVIVATGVRDVLPDVDGLAPWWGSSVLHCPYCHGWEVAGRRLAVIATSPASLHQIELVRQWSDDVTAFTADLGPLAPEVSERLAARGIRVVDRPVRSVTTGDGRLTALVDDAGTSHAVDAVFVAPAPEIALEFLSGLDLLRADQPGAPLAVDALGATSHPRIWAAGNVTAPFGNVPLSMGAGSMAGAAVNAALVAADAARAVAAQRDARAAARNAHWEERYAEGTRFWSGRVNATTAAVASGLPRGSALEIGCGDGDRMRTFGPHLFVCGTSRQPGQRYTHTIMAKLWRDACRDVGEEISMYAGLKHSSCSQYVNEHGLSLEEVKALADHANIESTRKYARVEVSRKLELYERGRLVEIRKAENTD